MKIEQAHFDNLVPWVQSVLDKNDTGRIQIILEEKWFTYPVAKDILEKLEMLFHCPKKSRMPSMLLVGDTNNGKTSILKRFISLHKNYEDENNITHIPIVFVQAPPSPDISSFYSKILQFLAIPYKNSDKAAKKEELIHYYFKISDVKMLIVDEIHNILSGPISKQKMFMNALKNLSNELQIPIVISGIADALHATNTDTQISNRFKPVFLSKWQMGREFLSLLASIEKTLPLKKASKLGQTKDTALRILDKSEGYIGEIIELVLLSAQRAIKTGTETITVKEIEECGYVKPSQRKNYLDIINI